MSVLFLPPSAGAASVPDASETVSGKIRIATSAEATAGTNDLTAMTPAKVKSVVDAAVVGGVTYKGTFDASAPLDLSNAEQGDLYVIDGAGTYQGIVWAVGDHLLVNADMGGTVDPNKLDKIDSTDSVTSVAGRTGAVTLSTADISGLATVATTGAYSDLTGTPTLATVATTGAYSDLTGTPTLGTAAALDVGTSASNVVQLNGSAQLPAVDGSLLTGITASVAALDDIGDVNITSVQDYAVLKYDSGASEWIDAPQINHVYTSITQSLDLKPGVNRVTMAGASSITLTLGIPTLVAGQGAVFSVLSTGSATNTLTIGSTSWTFDQNQGGVFVATGLNTAYMVSTIDYNQLENLPTLGTAAAEDVGTSAGNVVQLNGSAQLPAVDGSLLTGITASVVALDDVGDVNITSVSDGQALVYDSGASEWVNGSAGAVVYQSFTASGSFAISTKDLHVVRVAGTGINVALSASTGLGSGLVLVSVLGTGNTLSGVTFRRNGESASGGVTTLPLNDGERRLFYIESNALFYEVNATLLDSLADVNTSGAVATNVLKYDGTDWVDGAVAYSEVTGTPTLGTAAAIDVGTSPNNVVQLNGSAQLPAVDGSLLINLPSAPVTSVAGKTGAVTLDLNDNTDVSYTPGAGIDNYVLTYDHATTSWGAEPSVSVAVAPSVTTASPTGNVTLSAPSAGVIEEAYIYTPSTAITVNLVAAATVGSGFKYQIKNRSAFTITIDPNGSETIDGDPTFALSLQESSVTLITDGSNWFII